jgi:hypothetical protein
VFCEWIEVWIRGKVLRTVPVEVIVRVRVEVEIWITVISSVRRDKVGVRYKAWLAYALDFYWVTAMDGLTPTIEHYSL